MKNLQLMEQVEEKEKERRRKKGMRRKGEEEEEESIAHTLSGPMLILYIHSLPVQSRPDPRTWGVPGVEVPYWND